MSESCLMTYTSQYISLTLKNPKNYSLAMLCLAKTDKFVSITNSNHTITNLYSQISQDDYYILHSTDNRFSKVYFSPFSPFINNCVLINTPTTDYSGVIEVETNSSTYSSVLLYLSDIGTTVLGPKEGTICSSTVNSITVISVSTFCTKLASIISGFQKSTIPPNVLISVVPQLFHLVNDSSAINKYHSARQSVIDSLSYDPRNTLDITRRKGLANKCAESSCYGDSFIDHNNNKETSKVHDLMFNGNLEVTIAKNAAKTLCPSI